MYLLVHLSIMKFLNVPAALLIAGLFSCRPMIAPEEPLRVAKLYCNCLEDKLKGAKDSSVNINECNAVFAESRFMKIHLSDNRDSFSEAVLDSASIFFNDVGNIIDTMCLNKIDRRKVKKMPHAF
jgi:hypothetical protein